MPQCKEGLGVAVVLELSRDGDRKKLHGGVKFDKLPHTVMLHRNRKWMGGNFVSVLCVLSLF